MKQVLAITRKELEGYFGSPLALIFIGVFLAITLIVFFWAETFFARGIADVRPLFEWMPALMILLVAALTMRQWSEEQRSGTLEVLLTLPVPEIRLVLGKFLAVMILVAVSLAMTLFVPFTVGLLGSLDWGPVAGGYLAALLLAGAYAAIGLFVSSRTDNQIVALILATLVCGLFYIVGSGGVTELFGGSVADVLRAIGSGSRFASIQRGVVDLRDLVYYLSLSAIFLALNVISLSAKRWSEGEHTLPYRRSRTLTVVLLVANLVVFNVWLYPFGRLRLDLTENREYTLSDTTRQLLSNLQEPLTIRAYFSERTHPLLDPLVPVIRDMLEEYEVASGGMLELVVLDPTTDPEAETEANQIYGVQSYPFQVQDKYETSIVNAYFHILILYGDQSKVLDFQDLVEVDATGDELEVSLRNLEYDLTSVLKKVVYGFQSIEAVLASLPEPAQLTAYVTPDTLPEDLADVPGTIEQVAQEIAAVSGGKFTFSLVDPDAPDSPVTRQELYDRYGLRPIAVSIFSSQSYYFHMLLQVGEEVQIIYSGPSEAEVGAAIESALKRASSGFLQVVGLWTPPSEPTYDIYGQEQEPLSSWDGLYEALFQEYEVRYVDLSTGQVGADVDVLLLVAPQSMTDIERFAVDQHLMRGGSVIAAAGNYAVTADPYSGGLGLRLLSDGVGDLLDSYGIHVAEQLVLDQQNDLFLLPVTDPATGQFVGYDIIQYPFFVDIRTDGMDADSPIVASLNAVTLHWTSPITVSEALEPEREVTSLLQSTRAAWTQSTPAVWEWSVPAPESMDTHTLAVSVVGPFQSAFAGQEPPVAEDGTEVATGGLIEESPESSRLVVFGSTEFVDDFVFGVTSQLVGDAYLNGLQLVLDAVSWCTEDQELLEIRARGTRARLLQDLTDSEQKLWELANYGVALLGLAGIGILWHARRQNELPVELLPPSSRSRAKREVRR
jgi:ABC-2 type transport system permease protein